MPQAPQVIRHQWVVGPFQCNCRLLACPETGDAIVIDPGDEANRLVQAIQALKTPTGLPVQPRYIFHTHAHLDHIGGTRGLKQAFPDARILLHAADEPMYHQLKYQGRLFNINYEDPLPLDGRVEDTQELRLGAMRFTVIHTPGHSPGSVALRMHDDSALQVEESVFTGDTLFQGSVGRTDLWGADGDLMFQSIRTRLLTLDGDTHVCPGHGPDSRIGIEKRTNTFLN